LQDKCPECGSENLVHDYDTGETVCGDCGLVVYEQMMDKDQNGARSLRKRKHPEAESDSTSTQFMIKAYPQPSAKLTETHSEENCPFN